MLDAVDKVLKAHIERLSNVKGNSVPVFAIATADEDDQPFTQAGLAKRPDKIDLPFAALIRLPDIDITDDAITKRVHNYTGYLLFPESNVRLTYYRCTLHYTLTIFAENRKVCEDLATQYFIQLRNNCQITANIQLPIKHPDYPEKIVVVQMDSDIVMGTAMTQVNPQGLEKSQLYKCRIPFDVQNVNVYNYVEDKDYTYNVTVATKTERGKVSEVCLQEKQSSNEPAEAQNKSKSRKKKGA